MTVQRCAHERRVDRHFDGRLSVADEHAMREHLASCPSCVARYERHLDLETLDPTALGAERRLGLGLGLETRAPVLGWAAPAAALAVAAAVMLAVGLRDASTAGFTARGGERRADPSARASEVFVYRAVDHGQPSRAGSAIGSRDELAFAYENASAKPHLMIFGVDEHHRVVWYYPAWSNEATDPTSVAIETTPGRHLLQEAIAHELNGHSLEIHALFSDTPLSVKTVERLVASSSLKLAQLFPPGVVDSTVSFTVEQ